MRFSTLARGNRNYPQLYHEFRGSFLLIFAVVLCQPWVISSQVCANQYAGGHSREMSTNLQSTLSVQLPLAWCSAWLILTTVSSFDAPPSPQLRDTTGHCLRPSLETLHARAVIQLTIHFPSLKHHCFSLSDAQCLRNLVFELFPIGE